MNRNVYKIGAAAGVFAAVALAAGPALAAGTVVSQATAQSIKLSLAGTSVVSQQVTATNDGTGETKNDASTIPTLAGLIPGNNSAFVGVAPQDAGAKVDSSGNGNSFACAGVAGTGGGIVTVGNSSCKIGEGNNAATLDLANVKLGDTLLGSGAITSALAAIPGLGTLLQTLGVQLNGLTTQLTNALNIPVDLSLSLSTIEGVCTADPTSAQGDATLADAKINLTAAGTTTNLVTLPANAGPNTKVTNLPATTTVITNALQTELNNALGGALKAINPALVQPLQSSLLTPLGNALKPLTDAIQQYLADITLNEQTKSDGGKKIEVTALDAQVLPVLEQYAGSSLLGGLIGHVTCGPNAKVAANPTPTPTPTTTPTATPTNGHHVPTNVDSGLGGNQNHANEIIAAVAALLAMAGAGGTLAYRRYGMPRG